VGLLPNNALCLRVFGLLRSASARWFVPVCFLPRCERSIIGLRRSRPMSRPRTTRTCQHGKTVVVPAPRSAGRPHSWATPACRTASTAASPRRGRHPPHPRDACSDPVPVERVRPWRQAPPGDWHRQASRVPEAFHAPCTPPEPSLPPRDAGGGPEAFHEAFCMHPPLCVGLLAPRTGRSCHEAIAVTARRRPHVGRERRCGAPHAPGGRPEAPPPHRVGHTPAGPAAVQRGGAARGPCARALRAALRPAPWRAAW
jgi:hypothetical protein